MPRECHIRRNRTIRDTIISEPLALGQLVVVAHNDCFEARGDRASTMNEMEEALKLLRLMLTGALTAWFATASAQIFECIDANGNTEYTQKCRPGSVKQRQVSNSKQNQSPPQQPTQIRESVPNQNTWPLPESLPEQNAKPPARRVDRD